ncbi:UNVERIFIED_CONTAM: hypothetical protein GTU68_019048, partial [Idotea baltica]|nr:hypothetical protein [Idotea baltica]
RGELSIIAGRANPDLSQKIAEAAGVKLTECEVKAFSDGELAVEIKENVRGRDVFVVQSTSTPGNDHLMELLIIMDALRRASAERITAVIPYFGYARQDRKTKPRVAITAKLVADLIVSAGANRLLTMDLHAGQVMGFFNVPVDNLYARPVLLNWITEKYLGKPITIVSPDAGGVARARAYAKRLDAGLAIIDKRRTAPNEVSEMNVVGDVKGQTCILVDDMVDTGGTLIKAAEALMKDGAVEVVACASHAVMSGQAKQLLPKSLLKEVIVSDSIAHDDLPESIDVSVAKAPKLIGEAIKRINREDSVSLLFGDD